VEVPGLGDEIVVEVPEDAGVLVHVRGLEHGAAALTVELHRHEERCALARDHHRHGGARVRAGTVRPPRRQGPVLGVMAAVEVGHTGREHEPGLGVDLLR
jgi:hypothetical protein